ncbi:MAG TPA: hypothetical protein VHB25_14120 [Gemmatimonadaceae bacterium]|nr:hypothetical protein [Gemmatimonadaceae bacterium]
MRRALPILLSAGMLLALPILALHAQNRVGPDSATRLTRFGRDMAYGAAEGLGYAALDQWNNDPPQWGSGWTGYQKRAASNIGEFVIQESVTEGLAAVMNRPLDYTPCGCTNTLDRVGWAIHGAFTDELANGQRPLAVPRIVGAFVGSFAQAGWRPSNGNDRMRVALVNGATSLAFGAVINLYHEFSHSPHARPGARRPRR